MALDPSIPDYKKILINNLNELKSEFKWCLENPTHVTKEKILDFKRGVKNLKYFILEKIESEVFARDMERFDVLINKLPKEISDIEITTANLIFERLEKLIHDLK